MLLMIVLANTPWYLYGQTAGLAAIHPVDGSGLDRFVQLLIMTLIDFRVYPMFAFLFGYGMVQMFSRQVESGVPVKQARRLLKRRNWWLLAFGFMHAALLWNGDVLGAYGLAGLVMVGLFFTRRGRTLIIWGCVLTGLLTLSMLSAIVGSVFAARGPANEPATSFLANAADIAGMENYLESIVARMSFWPFLVVIQGLGTLVIPTVLLFAFWAARQRILEEPGSHLSLLRRVAVGGLAVGWSGGPVHALDLSAWGFGLGGVLGSAGVALFAVGVWLLTLVLAYAQERAGQRGPAEVLLRRLVYRRPSRSAAVEAGRP